jgi:peroxiredoxin
VYGSDSNETMSSRYFGAVAAFCFTLGGASCSRSSAPPTASSESKTSSEAARTTNGVSASVTPAKQHADLGQPAPDFTLPDLDGHPTKLSDFAGKIVVLEWFNPECPFVNATHTKGSLKGLAKQEAAHGVVWLGINSAAPGKQGSGKEATLSGKQRFGLEYPILLDETGAVGHAYGAAHTPHLFIVDAKGILVYEGAIDNSPDGEGESPTSGQLVNYVTQALGDLRAGQAVRVPKTEAYGCSVKY